MPAPEQPDPMDLHQLSSIAALRPHASRSISAENPTGAVGGGARAEVSDDEHTTQAARDLGRGWKVRPCLRIRPGETHTLAAIDGPGAVEHIWFTVDPTRSRLFTLRVFYDDQEHPSIECPVSMLFANGIDGRAKIASLPIAVNPTGGMNSYWPMPFRRRLRIEITNHWPTPHPAHPDDPREEFFYQITWSQRPVADDEAYLHAQWRRSTTKRADPQHVILDGVSAPSSSAGGHYVGTYLIWHQHSDGWWGEGEVKFFLDGDGGSSFPTICGTGTEDYFGGAWGFAEPGPDGAPRPVTYSTAFLGHPQTLLDARSLPVHGLYRWHVPDPVRFRTSLRVTIQALGWYPTGRYQPLEDDLESLALWYQQLPSAPLPKLPPAEQRIGW